MLKVGAINIFLKFSSLALVFIFQSYLAKLISIEDYSEFARFITYGNYLALATSFGFSSSILYLSKNSDDFKLNYITLLKFYVCLSCLLVLSISMIDSSINKIIIFAVSINCFNIALAYFQHEFKLIKFGVFSAGNGLYLILLILAFKYYEPMQVYVCYMYFGYMLTFSLVMVYKLKLKDKVNLSKSSEVLKSNLSYGLKFTPVLLIGQIIYVSDFLMIDVMLDKSQVAIYFVSMMLSKLIFTAADTIGNLIFPYLLKVSKGKDRAALLVKISSLSNIIFVMNLSILVIFYLSGKSLIYFFYGQDYISAYTPALMLLGGTHGMVIYKLTSRKLASENEWKSIYIPLLITAIINIVLNIILIDNYGIFGASLASAISYWMCGGLIVFFDKNKNKKIKTEIR